MATKKPEPVNLFAQPVLKVKRLTKRAELPAYATDGAGCFDIVTTTTAVLLAGRQATYETGIAVEIPPGYVLKIYSRSGMGFNKGVRLANGTGLIDSDYRGELKVCCATTAKRSSTSVQATASLKACS